MGSEGATRAGPQALIEQEAPVASKQDIQVRCGCIGCIGFILAVIATWALIFGVTVNGRRYGVTGCDTKSGVTIETGAADAGGGATPPEAEVSR
jgi:hypothetical protein